jgi:hypothetical protein
MGTIRKILQTQDIFGCGWWGTWSTDTGKAEAVPLGKFLLTLVFVKEFAVVEQGLIDEFARTNSARARAARSRYSLPKEKEGRKTGSFGAQQS